MTRGAHRFAALSGLALALVLTGGMLAFVGVVPASATPTLVVTGPASPQATGTGFGVTVSGATASASVTLALTTAPAGSTLTCAANTVTASASGVATFTGCVINDPSTGSGDVIGASDTSGDTAGSSSAFVVLGPASKLVFTTEPSSSATGGTPFTVQPVVSIEDAAGNVVTTNSSRVTLALAGSPTGAAITCTANPLAATAGVATFVGCSINLANSYTLTASDGTLTVALSSGVDVSAGSAARLGFTTEPSTAASPATAFAVQPVVSVEDAGGNPVASGADSTASVTLALTSATAGTALACTANPVAAVAGVATFTGCSINGAGEYTLTASVPGLAPGVSTAVDLGGTTAIAFAPSHPARIPAGSSATYTVTVTVQSGSGALTGTVTFSVNGTVESGCTSLALSSGKAKCTIAYHTALRYTVSAAYGNDPLYIGSSNQVVQVVQDRTVPKEIDTVRPAGSLPYGTAFHLRIHLYGIRGAVTGFATVKFAGKILCKAALSNGVGNCTARSSLVGPGMHRLAVIYQAQGFYFSHNQAVGITVT
jgi:hypothetical protein